jgi:integrase
MKAPKEAGTPAPGKRKRARRNRSREGGYKRMKGNLYARIQYTDEAGKQKEKLRRVPSGKISDVWLEVRKMRDELNHFGDETLQSDKLTFGNLADEYQKAKVFKAVIKDGHKVAGLKSHKPVLIYVRIAKEYFGRKRLRSITPRDIEQFKNVRLNTPVEIEVKRYSKEINPATKRFKKTAVKETRITPRKLSSVHRELSTLRRMLNYAVKQGWLLTNPFGRTENLISNASERAREKVLTYDEETRLLAACSGERVHLKGILICALDTAMRPDEIFKLVWRDVDREKGIIVIRAENTKIETERIVGITPRLRRELDTLCEQAPADDPEASVFGVRSVKTSFRTACRIAGVNGFRFRDCRHTATTRMVNSGMPQAEIMKMTGHTQLKTFLRYVNLTPASAQQNAETFGSFVGANLAKCAEVQGGLVHSHAVN